MLEELQPLQQVCNAYCTLRRGALAGYKEGEVLGFAIGVEG